MSPPRTGTTPTDSRRAQDRLAMPAPIWLPTGPLMEYGGKAYARQRGAMWGPTSAHTFSDMTKQRPADGEFCKNLAARV